MAKNVSVSDVTIAGSGTISTSLTLEGNRVPFAIQTPAALTGTSFTFEGSTDTGANFQPIYNEGTAYSVTVGTSRYIALNPNVFAAVKVVRVVSGTSEGGARTIRIISGE